MEIVLIVVIGFLFSAGTYLLLRRTLIQAILGLAILSQAVNMVLFVAGGMTADKAAFIETNQSVLAVGTADPLLQALILTAIVIGFAMLAFFIVLVQKVYSVSGTDNIEQMKGSDQ